MISNCRGKGLLITAISPMDHPLAWIDMNVQNNWLLQDAHIKWESDACHYMELMHGNEIMRHTNHHRGFPI